MDKENQYLVLEIFSHLQRFQHRALTTQELQLTVGKLLHQQKKGKADDNDIVFLLSALADEVMLSTVIKSGGDNSNDKVPFTRFGQHDAGVKFYDYLEQHQIRGNYQTLIICYCCLVFGYKGKYLLEGEERRRQLIDKLHKNIIDMENKKERGLCRLYKLFPFTLQKIVKQMLVFFLLALSLFLINGLTLFWSKLGMMGW